MDDKELLRRIRDGDETAWNQLYEHHIMTLWRYVTAKLKDVHSAEDVVSEVMLSFARKLPEIDEERGSLTSWLLTVARNKIADHFRKERLVPNPTEHVRDLSSMKSHASRRHDVRIEEVLDQLSEDEIGVLLWKYVDGEPVREIAKRLGKSEKAVESILFRARRAFKAAYVSESTHP